jgi:hypothetical protein
MSSMGSVVKEALMVIRVSYECFPSPFIHFNRAGQEWGISNNYFYVISRGETVKVL